MDGQIPSLYLNLVTLYGVAGYVTLYMVASWRQSQSYQLTVLFPSAVFNYEE